jgi:hypothetical protein
LVLSEMISHWSSAPSSTFRKKSRQAGLQSKVGDVPDDTSIDTGPVQSGSGPPGLVGSDEQAAIVQPKTTVRNVRIESPFVFAECSRQDSLLADLREWVV